jgi:gamma-glutamyltranspeptidase / glutathione hydrolase
MQDQAAIQLIVEYVDFGMAGEELFKADRFDTLHFVSSFGQGRAKLGSLEIHTTVSEAAQAELKNRGHVLSVGNPEVGGVALIGVDGNSKSAIAVGPAAGKLE